MNRVFLAFVLLLAAAQAPAQSSNRPNTLSAPGGRFVYGQISEFRSDQYLLDTHTGRLWKFITYCADTAKSSTCNEPVLKPVAFDTQIGSDEIYTPPSTAKTPPQTTQKQEPPKK